MNEHVKPEMQTWSVAEAKARLSEVIEKTALLGPQVITRNGRPKAVLVSIEDWNKDQPAIAGPAQPKESLAEFFMRSPLRGSGVVFERLDDKPREIDFGMDD